MTLRFLFFMYCVLNYLINACIFVVFFFTLFRSFSILALSFSLWLWLPVTALNRMLFFNIYMHTYARTDFHMISTLVHFISFFLFFSRSTDDFTNTYIHKHMIYFEIEFLFRSYSLSLSIFCICSLAHPKCCWNGQFVVRFSF